MGYDEIVIEISSVNVKVGVNVVTIFMLTLANLVRTALEKIREALEKGIVKDNSLKIGIEDSVVIVRTICSKR